MAVVMIAHQDINTQRGSPLGKQQGEEHKQSEVVPDDALSRVSGAGNVSSDTLAGSHFVKDECDRWAANIRARMVYTYDYDTEFDTGASFSSYC
jgi:hypothetical protein